MCDIENPIEKALDALESAGKADDDARPDCVYELGALVRAHCGGYLSNAIWAAATESYERLLAARKARSDAIDALVAVTNNVS